MRYKITDEGLKIFGENHEELFVNAVLGLSSAIFEEAEKLERRARGHKKITVESIDYNSLLVDFLNKVILEAKAEKKTFPRVKILRISPRVVEAQLFGVPIEKFDRDVEAVSCRDEGIKEKSGKLEAVLMLVN